VQEEHDDEEEKYQLKLEKGRIMMRIKPKTARRRNENPREVKW
jgi:hypothetical protein